MTNASESCYWCDESCSVGAGHCHCGCGATTSLYQYNNQNNVPIGTPRKFIKGHVNRHARWADSAEASRTRGCYWCARDGQECDVGAGMCHCGCGHHTRFIEQANRSHRGQGKMIHFPGGIFSQYLRGHSSVKFTTTQIRAMVQRHREGASLVEISREFGAAPQTVHNYVHRSTNQLEVRARTRYDEQGQSIDLAIILDRLRRTSNESVSETARRRSA